MAEGDDVLRALRERVKELTALHRATRLLLDGSLVSGARLQAIADLLPAAMQYPETATACVRHGSVVFATEGHAATPWLLTSPFQTSDEQSGEIEVAYHEARPMAHQGPFLLEEAALLASLGDIIAAAIDREHAEHALRDANERLNLTLDTAGMGFWEWDLRTSTVRWSRQMAAMCGLDGEKVGRFLDFAHLVHDEDRAMLVGWLQRSSREELPQGIEFRLRRSDGGWRPVIAYTGRVRDANGQPIRLLASVIDLTERRALEASLRQAQKLDALGQVAGGVAHDFNNLLTVILTGIDVLRAETPAQHPSRDLLDDMHTAAESGAAITRQLLSFSRKASFQAISLDPAALARRIEPILVRLAGKRVKVQLVTQDRTGRIWGDAAQLEQVLMNLVVNARDAMAERGGQVTVTLAAAGAELVARAGLPTGDYVDVSVADTGPGIPPDVAARIFEPFFTTKESGAGTGLGLAVVSTVAKHCGGGVVVDSAPGAGATFHVLFPQLAA